MLKIKFEYKDELSHGKWNKQECTVSSLGECIKIYGLGIDCDYEIVPHRLGLIPVQWLVVQICLLLSVLLGF